MTNYYVRRNGMNSTSGPMSVDQLKMMASNGSITEDDFISVDEVKWHPAGKVKGLFGPPPVSGRDGSSIEAHSDTKTVEEKRPVTSTKNNTKKYLLAAAIVACILVVGAGIYFTLNGSLLRAFQDPSKVALKVSEDKITKSTTYYHPWNNPRPGTRTYVSGEVSESAGSEPYLALNWCLTGNRQNEISSLLIAVDDDRFTVPVSEYKKSDSKGNLFWEWDFIVGSDAETIFRSIHKTKSPVSLRFVGKYNEDYTLSELEVKTLKVIYEKFDQIRPKKAQGTK